MIACGDNHPVDNQPHFWWEVSNRMLLHPPLISRYPNMIQIFFVAMGHNVLLVK